MIKLYTIVWAESFADLVMKVNNLIQEGWQPLGGVADTNARPSQAMVKYDTKPLRK